MRGRLIGGILMLVAAALVLLGLESESSVLVAITLMVVGVALVATARRAGGRPGDFRERAGGGTRVCRGGG